MNLQKLIDGIVTAPDCLIQDIKISGIALDSREIKPGFLFLAVDGAVEHGLVYLKQAIENGAVAIIYELKGSEGFCLIETGTCQIATSDLVLKLGILADRFYNSPSKTMDVIGVTGTNGKTSCSQFLIQMMSQSGVIGTLGWGKYGALKQTVNTTPDALLVQKILADFVLEGVKTAVMEVSSHGLQQGRVESVAFKGALYTNLSRDHLDYHKTMEAYLEAKLKLFKLPNLQFVVVNADDEYSEKVLAVVDKKVKKWTFSHAGKTFDFAENIIVDDVMMDLTGISFNLKWRNNKVYFKTSIVGDFNLENLMAVITVLLAQGYELEDVANRVTGLNSITGRMEGYGGKGQPFVFVDYAHTPDALEQVLLGLRQYCNEQLNLVFGCGGNRDKGKRVLMGSIAEKLADQVIITNDNPRHESPEQIVKEIVKGYQRAEYEVVLDREQAIKSMIHRAKSNDCIVIAGKGHEDYQEVDGVKQPFKDQDVVVQALQEWVEIA